MGVRFSFPFFSSGFLNVLLSMLMVYWLSLISIVFSVNSFPSSAVLPGPWFLLDLYKLYIYLNCSLS